MLKSLRIENYRCFQSFELHQLGQVNLLVGTNNSGKTSILEAVQLLYSSNSLEPLQEIMINRGEYIWGDDQTKGVGVVDRRELDIRHLFYGHEINVNSRFSIFSGNVNDSEKFTISVQGRSPLAQLPLFEAQLPLFEDSQELELFEDLRELELVFEWVGQENEEMKLRLSPNEGIYLDHVRRFRRFSRETRKSGIRTQFVTSSSLTTQKMIELFDQVVLTPEENLVTEALRTIEPNIERIASVGSERNRFAGSRSGFVVRLSDSEQRIPIGSMGDGIWRILGLTLAIVNARNGVLLVDEIDTGFHFSAMSKMWKLIYETAKRLNVQVFATTHNSDCWTSLAAIANTEHPSEQGITIQRIERGKPTSIVFNERQIAIAAERGIEVR